LGISFCIKHCQGAVRTSAPSVTPLVIGEWEQFKQNKWKKQQIQNKLWKCSRRACADSFIKHVLFCSIAFRVVERFIVVWIAASTFVDSLGATLVLSICMQLSAHIVICSVWHCMRSRHSTSTRFTWVSLWKTESFGNLYLSTTKGGGKPLQAIRWARRRVAKLANAFIGLTLLGLCRKERTNLILRGQQRN